MYVRCYRGIAPATQRAYRADLGNLPKDVSAEKRGYDIESRDPRSGILRFIEARGRHTDGRRPLSALGASKKQLARIEKTVARCGS